MILRNEYSTYITVSMCNFELYTYFFRSFLYPSLKKEPHHKYSTVQNVLKLKESQLQLIFLSIPHTTKETIPYVLQINKGNERCSTKQGTQQQRPELPTVTLTWHASKHKVHKPHQRHRQNSVTWLNPSSLYPSFPLPFPSQRSPADVQVCQPPSWLHSPPVSADAAPRSHHIPPQAAHLSPGQTCELPCKSGWPTREWAQWQWPVAPALDWTGCWSGPHWPWPSALAGWMQPATPEHVCHWGHGYKVVKR